MTRPGKKLSAPSRVFQTFNINRRQLSKAIAAYAVKYRLPLEQERAAERITLGGLSGGRGKKKNPVVGSQQGLGGRTVDRVAREVGLGMKLVHQVKMISDRAPRDFKKLLAGQGNLLFHRSRRRTFFLSPARR